MSQQGRTVSGWIVGLLVTGALAFGASVALAKPANAMSCQNDGWNFLGEKPTQIACFNACYALHGNNLDHIQWGSTNHCCACIF